jgi:phosphoglycolate phosphatase
MSRDYQLIIFDWDGTLVDSQAQIIDCVQVAFKQVGLEKPEATAIRHIIGLSLEAAFYRLVPEMNYPMVTQLADAYREQAFTNSNHATELFAGVRSGLSNLRKQGFCLAVATGKGRRGLDAALDGSNLTGLFDITRCADETRSKPDPLMLDEILTDLNIDSNKALMVGDTSYDIEMANNIGMDSIAVTYGMHDEHHLRPLNPRYLINHFSEIQDLIGEKAHV